MDRLPDFLRPLEFLTSPFPRDAVVAAIENRDEAIPYLLHSLEWVEQHVDEANGESTYMLHLFALYLLAQFRETRAYPLVIRLFRHPEYESLTGEVATDGLQRILPSVCGDDIGPIQALIEDRATDEWVRSAGVSALGALLFTGSRPREEISAYFGDLFAGRLEREPHFVWDVLVAVCTDFRLAEHLPAIRQADAEELIDPGFERLENIEREFALPPGTPTRARAAEYVLIDDTIEEMNDWSCFDARAEEDDWEKDEIDTVSGVEAADLASGYSQRRNFDDIPLPGEPLIRDVPKIGRNDRCPCGSGKKFKKCCGKG